MFREPVERGPWRKQRVNRGQVIEVGFGVLPTSSLSSMGLLIVRIIRRSGILDNGVGEMFSQWGSTIKLL